MQFGNLYPVFVKEASAGDSWHISSAFGLRFLPTYFPLQTKIRAKLDFFYVRNRNLYDDWKNWRFGTGNPSSFPILSDSELFEQSKTGSLGDYLGLPTTLVGPGINSYTCNPYFPLYPEGALTPANSPLILSSSSTVYNDPPFQHLCVVYSPSGPTFPGGFVSKWPVLSSGRHDTGFYLPPTLVSAWKAGTISVGIASFNSSGYVLVNTLSSDYISATGTLTTPADTSNYVNKYLVFWITDYDNTPVEGNFSNVVNMSEFKPYYIPLDSPSTAFDVHEATSVFTKIPYSVSALPFRAYEQIYNAFYRDYRNNPLLVDGVYDPNVFLPNTKGGVDSTPYRLHQRNWEQDFLTSAVPSPQYGNAPLVGITSVSSSGVASLTLDDGSVVESKLSYDKDDVVTGFTTTRSAAANSQLINLASQGISINDLRAVNSLQKYLELHYRRGLRYKDQMLAHRGIEIGYDVLDMPEFIGSCVQNIDVSQINQTVGIEDSSPLGSYAGQLSAVGGSKRLSKFCDEDGYIIGILSVVPVPCYSQLLPKHFTKINDPLEYFDPSFRNLGYQAIKYNEVCPLQAANSGVSLDSTFGYNRAWYDYIQSQDEVHGQFRTTLNNFVLSRVFNTVPSLSPDFLTVHESDLNDVFSISGTKSHPLDSILGQVHFDVACERQIPAYVIPSL